MPSLTLPGVSQAFYGLKGILARSLGFSRTYNPRNLEFLWYPLWTHVLCMLFLDIDEILIAPQWPVWLTTATLAELQEMDDEGPDDGEDLGADESALVEQESDEDDHNVDNYSHSEIPDENEDQGASASYASTAAQPNATSQIIDSAMLAVKAEAIDEQEDRYGGLRIDVVAIPAILENKNMTHRDLSGEALKKAILMKVLEMQPQMCIQAAYVLCRFPVLEYVYAIAAVGPYWCSTRIDRKANDHPEYSSMRHTVTINKWTTPLLLGTTASTKRLERLKLKIQELVQPIILKFNSGSESTSAGNQAPAGSAPQQTRAKKPANDKKVTIAVPTPQAGARGGAAGTSGNVDGASGDTSSTNTRRSARLGAKSTATAAAEGSHNAAGPSGHGMTGGPGNGKKTNGKRRGRGKK
ncbi:hypothetical protein OBBRIDRAFT_801482 [Obba rivulosa]|uniref:Uncharacterized protein n=1 Tax=Obba rivulosa TaxID=1052685 RepID=A0A8E2DQT2_9APHY|nr:hypothetical protein OBBRIDRAFT_801482 [Obba rivulosa]